MKIKYKLWECTLVIGKYENGNTAIRLLDVTDGVPVSVATVNVAEKLPKDEVYIKDYSENEGMVECLKKAGVLGKLISTRLMGYSTVGKYKLTTKLKTQH